ncbi:hypothetical protein NPIL_168611 [Nephila pilipes]|uniref:Uncharacterized protein n=1 Tax=Nephila pilipes TaxID=299642 RepID=A0A8X6KQY7_NEPPI|nr:hypothetical protein NPIL_168611 [Nephila pilipes]
MVREFFRTDFTICHNMSCQKTMLGLESSVFTSGKRILIAHDGLSSRFFVETAEILTSAVSFLDTTSIRHERIPDTKLHRQLIVVADKPIISDCHSFSLR